LAKKKVPPSRIKYDEKNPIVSARMPREERNKLFAVLKKLSLSLAQLLVAFADEYEIKLKPIEQAKKEGYEEGYAGAKEKFGVPFACAKCGKTLYITSPKSKVLAGRFMTENGWCHAGCLKLIKNS
jgi:hypothetical protein